MTQPPKEQEDGGPEWQPIENAPWQTVIEIRNEIMAKHKETALGTRGYETASGVHPDNSYFTEIGGGLVCATEWRPAARSTVKEGEDG